MIRPGALLRSLVRALGAPATQPPIDDDRAAHAARPTRPAGSARSARHGSRLEGPGTVEYAPHPDGVADPGEVVWTWVPYEEDPRRGKDRPVLIVGRDGPWLLALPMTSRDHDADPGGHRGMDAAQERRWFDIGSGGWDARGRPSEVRLDRALRLDPARVRREGSHLSQAVFDQVAAELRELGWR